MVWLGRVRGTETGAGRRRLRPVTVVLVGLAAPVVWIILSRLVAPSDATLAYVDTPNAGGITVTRVVGDGLLRPGDEVIAINGQPVHALLAGGGGPAPEKGDRLVYTVLRSAGEASGRTTVDVPVTTGSYPFLMVLRSSGSAVLLLVTFLAVSVGVFLRAPRSPATRTLLAIPVLISIGATSWPFGPQVVDVVVPYGHWPYIGGGIANALAWGAFLHLALTLPQPRVIVRHRPWFVGAGYVLPFVLYGVYLLFRLPGDGDPLDRLRTVLHVSLPAARTYPILIIAAILASLIRERGLERSQRIRWELVFFAASPALYLVVGQLPQALGQDPVPPGWLAMILLPLPVAVGSAVLRRRLFDVELVLRRSLVYGSLTGCLGGVYLLAVYLLTDTLGPTPAALFATALVALSVHPLRVRLQRAVGRRLFGQRHEPLTVASTLGRINVHGAPEAVLGEIVTTLAEVLRLSYAAVEVGISPEHRVVRATYGRPTGRPQTLPLTYAGRRLGQLHLSVAAGREAFGAADRRLLDELARQVGITGYTLLLATDLQRSRSRLLSAREEERRRLRRDLHDGLGPSLAATAMQLEVAQDLIRSAPGEAEALVGRLLHGTRRAIADIGRLVDGLRPPALDQLGLKAAIEERATYFAKSGTGARTPPTITVEQDGHLDGLPAAVEVAAFHIAVEAMNNVVRHASASTCRVRLEAGHDLVVEVADDGAGLPADPPEGVGLTSMQDRAVELGGAFSVDSRPGHGTTVRIRIPLPTRRPAVGANPRSRPGTGQQHHDDGTTTAEDWKNQ
ncbi:histidine kinase [Phytohabitans sp. LJ34]|uniref:histidine kinase n=1 Tax=Phytohabitans sp. LJ34 TaxID=3452217 RepID=UPI003F8944E0